MHPVDIILQSEQLCGSAVGIRTWEPAPGSAEDLRSRNASLPASFRTPPTRIAAGCVFWILAVLVYIEINGNIKMICVQMNIERYVPSIFDFLFPHPLSV